MNFKVQQHQLFKLNGRLNLMRILVVGLLISNSVLALVISFLTLNQRVEVTPFFGSSKYSNSMLTVDSEYLKLMSENFIFLRLNTSPESVVAEHKQLLSLVSKQAYPLFLRTLEQEMRVIKNQKISSHFDIQHMRVDSQKLECHIQGILHRTVGIRELQAEKASYLLKFQYHLGHLKLHKFVKENVHEN